MAVTQEKSTELNNFQVTSPPVMNETHQYGGRKRTMQFNFTQGAAAGDAGSLAELIKLPAGRVTVFLNESRYTVSAFGAARTSDLGWLAYEDENGTAVAADPNGLDDGADVSGAATITPTGTIGGNELKEFQSKGGVTITQQTNDGTIPIGATISGYITYQHD